MKIKFEQIFINPIEIKNGESINIEYQQIFDSKGNLEQLKILKTEKIDSENNVLEKQDYNYND